MTFTTNITAVTVKIRPLVLVKFDTNNFNDPPFQNVMRYDF